MLISKKELLAETGISYGQLYRWKRERLIPEEWFIKQSSFTGQETFFPKEQILNRIRSIQELKDNYSLEELAKLLSPEINEDGFRVADLEFVEEINRELMSTYSKNHEKDTITYMEVLTLAILSGIKKELNLDEAQISGILLGIQTHLETIKSTDYIFRIFQKDGCYYGVLYQNKAPLLLDSRFETIKEVSLNDISNELKIRYRGKFKSESDTYGKNRKPDETEENKAESVGDEKDKTDKTEKEPEEKQDTSQEKKKKKQENEDFILKINNWEVRL